jgi:hypothetical protein
MVERKASVMRGRLEELAGNKELSSMAKIEILVEEFITRMFGHRDFTLTIMREMSKSGNQELRERLAGIFIRNMSVLKSIIEEGMRTGEFKPVDAVLTISTIYGTIWNLISTEVMLKLVDQTLSASENLYGDAQFRERVVTHLRSLLRGHLLNRS